MEPAHGTPTTSSVLCPINILRQHNSKVENGLHADFMTTELNSQESRNLFNAGRLRFLWNPRLERDFGDVIQAFESFQPEYVVLGAGLWFLAENKDLEKNLAEFEHNWRKNLG